LSNVTASQLKSRQYALREALQLAASPLT